MDDAQFVATLRGELAARIGAERYELWFGPQAEFCLKGDVLEVRAPNAFVRDWLRRNFEDDLAACAQDVLARTVTVEFAVAALRNNGSVSPNAPVPAEPGLKLARSSRRKSPSSNPQPEIRNPQSQPGPNDSFERRAPSLAQLVVGPSNEYAFRSAELTAHGRQQASPILLWGPTGVGKTHLLRAIQSEFRRRHSGAAAIYLTAEQFTTCFVDALRGSGLPGFRQKCRGAQLLLIDDLQFFVGKARTIEELHHTVDTLVAAGRQLVLASDRNLTGLRPLGAELVSRLAGGLTCEIAPPEFATRLEIARRLRDELQLSADDDVLALVAAQISAGARELRGALHRLNLVSRAWNKPITRELAETVLADLVRQSTRAVRLADVEQAVCDVFQVEAAALRSERKGRAQSEPRMLAMWLARKYTRAAWSEIGEFFGRRSHSTVIAAHRRVEKLITSQAKIGVGDAPCGVEEAIRRLETAIRTA